VFSEPERKGATFEPLRNGLDLWRDGKALGSIIIVEEYAAFGPPMPIDGVRVDH
jgi:hypothetical protein